MECCRKSSWVIAALILLAAIVLPARAQDPYGAPPGAPGSKGPSPMAYKMYMEGMQAENAGDYTSAIKFLRMASDMGPMVKEIKHELAKCYARTGQNDLARGAFRSALNIDSRYVECRNNYGMFLWKTGKKSDAETQFQTCVQTDPKYPFAWYNYGKILREKGDLTGAIDKFEHAVNLKPDFAEAQEGLGMAIYDRAAQGDLSQAMEKLQAAVRLVPKNPRIHYHLGIIYATKSKLDAAENEFRTALMNEPQFAAAHWELAKVRYYRGDTDRALGEIKQALAVNPSYTEKQGYPDIDLIKVKTLEAQTYEHMGDPVRELEVYNDLVSMRRSDRLYADKIKSLTKEVKRLTAQSKRDREKLPYDPAEVDAYVAKGIDAYEDGDLDSARASFERGLELNPKSFRCEQNLCFVQEAQGDLQTALATAQKALALNPDYDGAVYNLAYLLEKGNLPQEAAMQYQKFRGMVNAYPYDSQHIIELQQNIIREEKKEQTIRRRGY